MARAELAEYLLGLTDRLGDLVQAPGFDPGTADRVGGELVAAHVTGPETLNRSLAVLREAFPRWWPVPGRPPAAAAGAHDRRDRRDAAGRNLTRRRVSRCISGPPSDLSALR